MEAAEPDQIVERPPPLADIDKQGYIIEKKEFNPAFKINDKKDQIIK